MKIIDSIIMKAKGLPIDIRSLCDKVSNIVNDYVGLITYEKDSDLVKYKSKRGYQSIRDINYNSLYFYGCLADGSDETELVQEAINDISSKNITQYLIIPRGVLFNVDNLIIPEGFIIQDDSFTKTMYKERLFDYNAQNETHSFGIHKKVRTEGGNENGFVTSALFIKHDVDVDNNNFQWATTSVLNNHSDHGENVAIYGQAKKYSKGGIWGACFETRDYSDDVSKQQVGIEVDVFGNNHSNYRVGIDIVSGKNTADGDANIASCGLRVGSCNGDRENGRFDHSIMLNAKGTNGINLNGIFVWGINFTGTSDVGLNTSASTITTGDVIRMKDGQGISFDGSSNYRLSHIDSALKVDNMGLKLYNTVDKQKPAIDTTDYVTTSPVIRLKKKQKIALDETNAICIWYNNETSAIEFLNGSNVIFSIPNTGYVPPTTT